MPAVVVRTRITMAAGKRPLHSKQMFLARKPGQSPRVGADKEASAPAPQSEPLLSSHSPLRKSVHCNLDLFLESTCPAIRPQHLPKSCQLGGCQQGQLLGDAERVRFFTLEDLWDQFDEWSAYGAGVPITLGKHDIVMQYYVPYLSALQLYTRSGKMPSTRQRQLEEDSDTCESDTRDSGSEGGSDWDSERMPECCWRCNCNSAAQREASSCCGCDHLDNDTESDDENSELWSGHLFFEYFEETPPHARVPLVDKIAELSRGFPALTSMRSIDLLPASWVSVAWYPIYRIPTGPTLRDLEACFLTFHCLSTSLQDGTLAGIVEPKSGPLQCSVTVSSERESSRIILQPFGLAHYKLRGSIWTTVGNPERRHAASLYRCAESWLQRLNVRHPDFEFFKSHNPSAH